MAGRKIEDAKEARKCLKAARASGLTNAAWSRREGIDGRSLHAWLLNLDRSAKSHGSKRGRKSSSRSKSKPARPRVVELVPVATPRPSVAAPRYAVRCGELSIELDDHFEEETLRRLLRVVASC